ncbi:hypothetical protein [Mycolicibacterium houstonense]|uniref:hypothetical protein n=1 Tax=Mycolicibacterium houstonense TaxID=146021 RepID=UPI00082E420D|nr:hypothetical protein [Mycolicibacterium houstonense]
MGDWSQSLVDVEVSAGDAPELGARLTRWLIDTGVISAEQTDCVLGSPLGHPPGPNYGRAVGGTDPAPVLWTNGAAISVGRVVSYSYEPEVLICRLCQHRELLVPNDEQREAAFAAIGDWADGGAGAMPCPSCGAVNDLNGWDWKPAWGFGLLTMEVWNWHPLAPEFIAEISRFLGHRVVYTSFKL